MNKQPIKSFKPTKAHKEAKWKEAIKLLNEIVKIKLAPSPIHGVGVFALRDMKKGERVYADITLNAFDLPYKRFSELRPEVSETLLNYWGNIINGSHFLYPVTKMSGYINHSDNPNFDMTNDVLSKDVKKGEEITEDYRTLKNYKKLYKWLK